MYICSLWYRHSLQVTVLCTSSQDSHLRRVTIPEAAYIQLRRRPPEDEQGNARNTYRILINVLYVNKQEFCASSWRSTKVILQCTVNQSSTFSTCFINVTFLHFKNCINQQLHKSRSVYGAITNQL
jgi:hypothetical protein